MSTQLNRQRKGVGLSEQRPLAEYRRPKPSVGSKGLWRAWEEKDRRPCPETAKRGGGKMSGLGVYERKVCRQTRRIADIEDPDSITEGRGKKLELIR